MIAKDSRPIIRPINTPVRSKIPSKRNNKIPQSVTAKIISISKDSCADTCGAGFALNTCGTGFAPSTYGADFTLRSQTVHIYQALPSSLHGRQICIRRSASRSPAAGSASGSMDRLLIWLMSTLFEGWWASVTLTNRWRSFLAQLIFH